MITANGKLGLRPIVAFLIQFFVVGFVYAFGWALTYFPMGILVALTAKKAVSPFGEEPRAHDQKYIDQGASGWWEYWATPIKWLNPWNNLEDGSLGESSGKTSARCKGKERTFWNQYLWMCRNPFNTAKRTSDFFACFVNDCVIQYWGVYTVSDSSSGVAPGWQLVKATRKTDGKTYWGFQYLYLKKSGKVFAVKAGFKIKPAHANQVQDADDLDKAWTFNVHFNSDPA